MTSLLLVLDLGLFQYLFEIFDVSCDSLFVSLFLSLRNDQYHRIQGLDVVERHDEARGTSTAASLLRSQSFSFPPLSSLRQLSSPSLESLQNAWNVNIVLKRGLVQRQTSFIGRWATVLFCLYSNRIILFSVQRDPSVFLELDFVDLMSVAPAQGQPMGAAQLSVFHLIRRSDTLSIRCFEEDGTRSWVEAIDFVLQVFRADVVSSSSILE